MKIYALIFLAVLAADEGAIESDAAPQNAPPSNQALSIDALKPAIDAIVNSTGLEGSLVGLHVVSAKSGRVLYSKNAGELLVPASTIKILTTAAALHDLGPDYRFDTEIYGHSPDNGVIVGNLTLKGYGDPWLVPERVWYLANRLLYQGVREIRGDIVVDDSYFGGPREAAGHEQDDSSSAYMAPAGALSVGFNAIQVHIIPAAADAEPARILIEPQSDYLSIEADVRTIAQGRSRLSVEVDATETQSIVRVSGRISRSDGPRSYWRRIHHPALQTGHCLHKILEQLGIKTTGTVRIGQVPAEATKLVSLKSPRLADLVTKVNKYSNNFMASQLARTMGAHKYEAPGTWAKGKENIVSFLQEEVGIAPQSYQLANASGLHDVNRVSAQQISRLLYYMYKRPDLRTEFVNSLAVAAGTGTLSDRMQETSAKSMLRAKTGTLSIASALSGYVYTRSGDPVIFSMIVNHFQKGITPVWQEQDRLGDTLARLELNDEGPSTQLELVGVKPAEPRTSQTTPEGTPSAHTTQ